MSLTIHGGCILEWAKHYDGEPFHALLSDPPYHLTSIVDRFGDEDAAPAREGVYARSSTGFMGQEWDGGDIAFQPATWKAIAKHLYPGAFGFAFASTRGSHRMACAIEDAGLIIHPTNYVWTFGSGFAKATRIDTQIDKKAGAERKVIGHDRGRLIGGRDGFSTNHGRGGIKYGPDVETAPATDLAKDWAGHRYGGQVIKPAIEPLVCFQKPYPKKGTKVASMIATGAGALNVRAAAVGDDVTATVSGPNKFSGIVYAEGMGWDGKTVGAVKHDTPGRWPANFSLVCAGPGYCGAGKHHDQCPIQLMREQRRKTPDDDPDLFFLEATWDYEVAERLLFADEAFYQAKPGVGERDAGLTSFVRETRNRVNPGGLENDPKFAPVSRHNSHPTQKPITLTKWLASLLLPPGRYSPRRILVPFAGAGSECIGASLAGWEQVYGVELSPKYAAFARHRLAHWSNRRVEIEGKVDELKEKQTRRLQTLWDEDDDT